jgi:hypothetical protein
MLADMNRWRSISLAWNRLQGPLLPDWGVLTNLTTLDLSYNFFSGTLPLNWNNLRAPAGSGVILSVAGNALVTGPLPAGWAVNGSNWALRKLDASDCSLTGQCLGTLAPLCCCHCGSSCDMGLVEQRCC